MENKKISLIIILLCTILTSIYSQTINIELQDSYIEVGDWTTFTVTISGNFSKLTQSETPDLEIQRIGTTTSSSFSTNGGSTAQTTYTFRVRALNSGEFNIPIFTGTTKSGEIIESEILTLYVDSQNQGSSIENIDFTGNFESEYVKLFIDLPDRNLYVGEAIPVSIRAYFSTEFQPGFERYPYIKTGSFILDNNDKYKKSNNQRIINGKTWIELEWNSHLTPLKSGNLDLEVVLDSYIEKHLSTGGFFTTTEKEDISTTTQLKTLDIKNLPIDGRPRSFKGAIGDFQIRDNIDNTNIKVGDPITLTIAVYGEGNFQRLSIPQINDPDKLWKLYPESSTYNGNGNSNYKGVKTFEQILSPNTTNATKSPKFQFSYFNPITETYETLETNEYEIEVAEGEFINSSKSVATETLNPKGFNEVKEDFRHKPSSKVNYTKPIFTNPVILLPLALLLVSILLVSFTYLKNSKKENPEKELKSRFKILKNDLIKEENNENYLRALEIYYKATQEHIGFITAKSINSITYLDATNKIEEEFMTKFEEIKYTKSNISKDQYDLITTDIKKEILC